MIGTGFLLDDQGHVLTAHHVMEARHDQLQQGQEEQLFVDFAHTNVENMRGNYTLVGCEVVVEDPRNDVALLRLRQNPFTGGVRSRMNVKGMDVPLKFSMATCDPKRPRDGEAVAVSGYPFENPVLVTNSGALAAVWELDLAQVQPPEAPAGFTDLDIADRYLADLEANGSNSGGPVYWVADGRVLGVCVATRNAPVTDNSGEAAVVGGSQLHYSSGLTLVVPIKYGLNLLHRHSHPTMQ